MPPQDTPKNPTQTPTDQTPSLAGNNSAVDAGGKMAQEVYPVAQTQVPERGKTPAEIAAERRARRYLPTTEAPPPLNIYEQQQDRINKNLPDQVVRAAGSKAPKDVLEFAKTVVYPLNDSRNLPPERLTPEQRQLTRPEIYYPERAKTLSYLSDRDGFKRKEYYPDTQPALLQQNLSTLADWDESELFTIGRGLKEALLLNKGPNIQDLNGISTHDKAKQIVEELIPKMTWNKDFPKPVTGTSGNQPATDTAYWTRVERNYNLLRTVSDNQVDLVQAGNRQVLQRGSNPFFWNSKGEPNLRGALARDAYNQVHNLNPDPHAARDAYLASMKPRVSSQVISQSPIDAQAKENADKQSIERMAAEVGQKNSIGIMHAKLSEAAKTNDANQAKQLLEEAAKANPDFANWINANNSNSQDLLYKLQAIRVLLGSDPTKQVPVAVETCVTPDLLRIVETQIQHGKTTPAENIFAAAVSRQIQHATTMFRNPKEPVETTIARNVAGIERQLPADIRLYLARNRSQRLDQNQLQVDLDKLMAPIRAKAGK